MMMFTSIILICIGYFIGEAVAYCRAEEHKKAEEHKREKK